MAASVIDFRVGEVSILTPCESISQLATGGLVLLSLQSIWRRLFVVTHSVQLEEFRIDLRRRRTPLNGVPRS